MQTFKKSDEDVRFCVVLLFYFTRIYQKDIFYND